MANEPLTAEQIRNEVRKFVAEITERDPGEISDMALFVEDLGIDSLGALEMMVAVDKKYKIEISEEEFGKIKNVNDAVEVVLRRLAESASAPK